MPGFVVVLEGPDGAGKTTLARRIAEQFNLHYHHEGPEPELDGPQLFQRYYSLIESLAPAGVVFDRLAVSERVYAAVLGRPDRLGPTGEAILSVALTKLKAVRVLCLPPAEVCLQGAFARGEGYVNHHQVLSAWSRYFARMYDPRWTKRYDWTVPGAEADLLQDLHRRRLEQA